MEEQIEERYQQIAAKINEIKKDAPKVSIVLPMDLLDDSVGSKYLKAVSETLRTFTNVKDLHLEFSSYGKMENIDYEGVNFMFSALEQHLPKLEKLSLVIKAIKLRNEGTKSLMKSLKLGNQVKELVLLLDDNYIEDEGMIAIRDTLKDFKQLTYLHISLSYSSPKDEGKLAMSELLEPLSHLKGLNLNYSISDFDDKSIVPLANALKNYHHLTKLHLNFDYSYMKTVGVGILVGAVENLQCLGNLTEFSLLVGYPSQFPIEDTHRIAKLLTCMPNLEYLYLEVNEQRFEHEGGQALLNSIGNLKKLKFLTFNSFINFTGPAAYKNFSIQLRSLDQLQNLSLGLAHNNIGDEGLIPVLESIVTLKKLQRVNLLIQNNDQTNAIVPLLTRIVKELPLLKDLGIDYGSQDSNTENFPDFISALKASPTIQKLRLEFNNNSSFSYDIITQLREIAAETNNKNNTN